MNIINLRASTLHIFIISISFFSVLSYHSKAQESDSTELANLTAELDAIFANESDSLSLMNLIDSILSSDISGSFLSLRLGYSSRITSAGRSFGVDQQGIIPSVSYYHKSGLFGDATGIWNNELEPKYYLTILTAGYIGSISNKWSYALSYDHSFYHSSDDTYSFPLTNSLNSSLTVDLKHIYTGIDYSFSFGDDTANSISWNATGVIKKKAFKPFKTVSFLPSISILFGTQNITDQYNAAEPRPVLANLTDAEIEIIARRRRLSQLQKQRLIDARDEAQAGQTTSTSKQFGLMNYYISLPILLTSDKFGITISYNYNIPKAITGSDYSTESNGYFGFTLSYNLGF
ncbi:hypothetical protein [Reichenbachiella sp. MALMAid0571]|uniref:hypothetical protein n=1 Tax=Reichenbachiella sp. MALMAid0571 TaxID=3143939 RepID=UPI0032E0246B